VKGREAARTLIEGTQLGSLFGYCGATSAARQETSGPSERAQSAKGIRAEPVTHA